MNIDLQIVRQLQYVLLPGRRPPKELSHYHEIAYQSWKEVWVEAYVELGERRKLHSDAFSRQDEVGALFFQDKCVALCFFNYVDLNQEFYLDDSYYGNWTDKAIQELTAHGSQVISCSNFTVHPSVRRNALGFSMKDLLMGLLTRRFLYSSRPAMTGAMRKDRSMHNCTIRWGAKLVEENQPSGHGDLVDLVAFFKEEVGQASNNDLYWLAEKLWKERIESDEVDLEKLPQSA